MPIFKTKNQTRFRAKIALKLFSEPPNMKICLDSGRSFQSKEATIFYSVYTD